MPAESALEKTCRLFVEEQNGRFPKWTSPGSPGVCDRILLIPGCPVVFVELKAKNGKLSRLQKLWLGWLRTAGFQAWVISDYFDFVESVEALMEMS